MFPPLIGTGPPEMVAKALMGPEKYWCLGSETLKNPEDPMYPLVKEFSDVALKHPPSQLPPDRGVRHEIDFVAGTKYCVTKQWPLPREQCLLRREGEVGMVRESKSPHSTPTFCIRKPNGKWRLVHAYNKLNNATVPAQTPIPRKDVLLNNMSGCTLYSALDLVDGYYQILKRESDIPLTAVSTPSGMLWEWLVMPQGLSNAPATFNRLSTAALLAGSAFVPIQEGQSHCGLANPKVTEGPPEVVWEQQHQDAFHSIKASLQHVPVLALLDENQHFCMVSDATDYAIGFVQKDDEGRERVISFQSRPLKAAERNYPVHDKELLAMKYALAKLRVYILGPRPFVIYIDHASLRTATTSPRLSQHMAAAIFAEYNFRVEYKPGKLNLLADALSRRPDYELVSRQISYQEDENFTPLVQFLSNGKDAKVDRLTPRQRALLH
ncbi:LOW QUALITY PROTEIN: Pol protein [Phytophthora palmivora]|uniref:Pol protein n=1 Tax=Phytophthora palmivora TaxID=4796 RepID=A0A2P4X181_9STRA|nr:LOW QUALITY PROTEIN: Pol protein [Phytophthora palmivora]